MLMRHSLRSGTRGLLAVLALFLLVAALRWRTVSPAEAAKDTVTAAPLVIRTAETSTLVGWPCFLGAGRDSVSTDATGLIDSFPPAGPRELWRKAIGNGYSSPIVTDAGLFLFHRQGELEILECCDPATGNVRWRFDYPTKFVCKYEYSNGPYSTPTIDGDCAYVLGAEGKLHCLRTIDGRLVWQRDLKVDYDFAEQLFATGASPFVDEQRVYLPIGGRPNAGIIALDKHTGETLWTATDHEAGYASPVKATMHGHEYLFVFNKFGLVVLDPVSGAVHWQTPFASRGVDTVCATSPVVWRDHVLVTMGPAPGALCIRAMPDGTFQEVWRDRRALDSTWNNVVQIDGHLFGFTCKRQRTKLRSLDLLTGKVRWDWESDLDRGALLAADGKLIAWGEYGHLALLDLNPDEHHLRSMTPEPLLSAPCYAMPALHCGRLYLRNETTLLCLDIRKDSELGE